LFCFAVLGIEFRVSHMLGRCSTTWATPLTPPPQSFLLVFEIGCL
jgi:hypothetical protein